MRILITGGAGYIGSHVVAARGEKGAVILVYDNLSTGHQDSLLYGKLVVGDLNYKLLLEKTIKTFKPDAVLHFAAFIQVGESVREPLKYYRNNSGNAINLLEAMTEHGVRNFIFSSTAAVYGNPVNVPITEDEAVSPINPYGHSKSFIETVLRDVLTRRRARTSFFQARHGIQSVVGFRRYPPRRAARRGGGRVIEAGTPEKNMTNFPRPLVAAQPRCPPPHRIDPVPPRERVIK